MNSPTGNQTPLSRVAEGDNYHKATGDRIVATLKYYKYG